MERYKLILKKNDKTITTLSEWKEIAPPKKKEIHWKDGRSAKELAKYMINGNGYLPIEIEKVLEEIGIDKELSFIGTPEAVTSLIGRGEGRNHDLLLNGENKVVVGIEAKADEGLGKYYVSEELSKSDISDNKIKRINSLYKDVYGTEDLKAYNPRYQLLTAVVGTLKEAENVHATKAILLIISFLKDENLNNKKIENNKNDIQYFEDSISKFEKNGKYNLPGYNNIDFYLQVLYIS